MFTAKEAVCLTRLLRTTLAISFSLAIVLADKASAQDDQDIVDPQETVYSTGDEQLAKEALVALPKAPTYRSFLPVSADLSANLPTPGNQGAQTSCVGWAVGYAARSYYVSAGDGLSIASRTNIPSPSYIYNLAKAREGSLDCGKGMAIPDALEILKSGAVSLSDMPYDPRSCRPPSEKLREAASRFRIDSYQYIPPRSLETIKGELALGHPVVFGMKVTKNFMRHRGTKPYRAAAADVAMGGHAMVAVGYDERLQALRIQNSWGRGWGDRGRAWLPYDAFVDDVYSAFVMRPVRRTPPPVARAEPAPPAEPKPAVLVAPPTPSPRDGPEPLVPPPPARIKTDRQPPVPAGPPKLELPCAKLAFTEKGGVIEASGFVGGFEDLERVSRVLAGRPARVAVDVRPWPQCEVLLTLDAALSAGDRPEVAVSGGRAELIKGQPLVIDVRATERPAHIHVAYVQADGSVIHLAQADAGNLRTYEKRQTVTFGDGKEGRAGFRASAPFGTELVVVLAARSPIFPDPRPQKETEREFLSALRRALLWMPDDTALRDVSAAFAAIQTKER